MIPRIDQCECPSPAHCLEALGGEQGLTADELELARLRRELDEARAEIVKICRERQAVRYEREEIEARWCAEIWHANSWYSKARVAESERDEAKARCRAAAQILIASIGAVGPENVEETARRAASKIATLRTEHHVEERARIDALAELDEVRAARDEALAKLELERGQKKADLLQDLAEVTVALRDLIASVEAARCRDTIVLRDLEAARALLGEGRS